MYFDAITLTAVADELRETLVGGRVQAVLQPDEFSIGLEVYAGRERRYLLASAHPQHARVHFVAGKLRRGTEKPSPFLLILRKYVRGGRVRDIDQPSFERVLRISIDHPDEGTTTLVIEVMGKYSNLVFVAADEIILGCLKPIGPQLNRYRVTLPKRPYVPPPPQEKTSPVSLTPKLLRDLFAKLPDDTTLWQALVRGVTGTSPLLAREVAFRATGRPDVPISTLAATDYVCRELADLWRLRPWQPSVAKDGEHIVAFAPYRLAQYRQVEPASSISQAVESYFAQTIGADAYAGAKTALRRIIDVARERELRRREALTRALAEAESAEQLRADGELVLAYAATIAPGQSELVVEFDGSRRRITLDPKLTPVENAQMYFRDYKKAKAATREVPPLLERTEVELRYLDQLATDLDLASNGEEIQEVEAALAEAGHLPKPRRRVKVAPSKPLTLQSVDGFAVLIGRNARQNEEVTFGRGTPGDLWLHARGAPGAHVVVKSGSHDVPLSTIRQAAAWAAYFSAARDSTRVSVDYTRREHVRRIKGAKPGLVTYSHETTLAVKPRAPAHL
jgi:predicted ribosome quality control (RQC) complex YloA/Tae2 family protein